jgi:hypothetical protein
MKAFPSNVKDSGKPHDYFHGMDLRDYFAAKAMQALIEDEHDCSEWLSQRAYQYADAMMKAREKS